MWKEEVDVLTHPDVDGRIKLKVVLKNLGEMARTGISRLTIKALANTLTHLQVHYKREGVNSNKLEDYLALKKDCTPWEFITQSITSMNNGKVTPLLPYPNPQTSFMWQHQMLLKQEKLS
jgi:hypothetical protein